MSDEKCAICFEDKVFMKKCCVCITRICESCWCKWLLIKDTTPCCRQLYKFDENLQKFINSLNETKFAYNFNNKSKGYDYSSNGYILLQNSLKCNFIIINDYINESYLKDKYGFIIDKKIFPNYIYIYDLNLINEKLNQLNSINYRYDNYLFCKIFDFLNKNNINLTNALSRRIHIEEYDIYISFRDDDYNKYDLSIKNQYFKNLTSIDPIQEFFFFVNL